jgi:hypothetical protein
MEKYNQEYETLLYTRRPPKKHKLHSDETDHERSLEHTRSVSVPHSVLNVLRCPIPVFKPGLSATPSRPPILNIPADEQDKPWLDISYEQKDLD